MTSSGAWPWLRDGAMCLAVFVVFDVLGVLLTVVMDLLGFLYYTLNWSGAAPYVIWFVVGVFTATALYFRDPPRRGPDGVRVVACTAAVAFALGLLSTRLWSWSGEPVAPDHVGVTVTWLVASVVGAIWWHHVVTEQPQTDRPAAPPP